jgi:hypothetical protein
MANAFVIEHRDLTAGIAVRERGSFPFYSSGALFLTIETQRFRRLRENRTRGEACRACRERSSGGVGSDGDPPPATPMSR